MPLDTLWESICRLAGDDGTSAVSVSDAVNRSAVPAKVAHVELRRMIDDGLVEGNEEHVQLTERGRKSCFDLNKTTREQIVAPETPGLAATPPNHDRGQTG